MKKIYPLTLILLFCTIVDSFGQTMVGTQDLTITDPTRQDCGLFGCSDRQIGFDIYYPSSNGGTNGAIIPGEYPFISFGHGFNMATSEFSIWYNALASSGYIIALPRTEGGLTPSHEDFAIDLALLVRWFGQTSSDPTSFFFDTYNTKSAIMGHSMGGGCTFTAGTLGVPPTTLVTLAAVETNGVSAIASAALLKIPTLTIAGSADCVATSGQSAGAPIDIFNNHAPEPYHAYVEIYGASHCQFGIASFGSICTLGEIGCAGFMPIAEQHAQMFRSALPWLDFYLRDNCQSWLDFRAHAVGGDTESHDFLEGGELPKTIVLEAKVIFEGPYDEAAGVMNTDLVTANLLPSTEPFTGLGFTHYGLGGGEMVDFTTITTPTEQIVDWILVELRDKTDPSIVIATKSALLQSDGDIVDLDGTSPLALFCIDADSYHVAIRHRNHLGIMTMNAIPLSGNSTPLDFTGTAIPLFGTPVLKDFNGVKALWMGDTDQSGTVDAADRSATWNDRNLGGYLSSDVNLDGQADAADRSATWNNRNLVENLP